MCCLELQTGATRPPRPTQSTFCKLVFYGRHATLGKWVVKFTNHKPVASTCPTLCRVKSNFQSDQQKKLSGRKGGRASDRGGSKNDCADENDDATQSVSLSQQRRWWCRTTTNPRINTKHLRSSCCFFFLSEHKPKYFNSATHQDFAWEGRASAVTLLDPPPTMGTIENHVFKLPEVLKNEPHITSTELH